MLGNQLSIALSILFTSTFNNFDILIHGSRWYFHFGIANSIFFVIIVFWKRHLCPIYFKYRLRITLRRFVPLVIRRISTFEYLTLYSVSSACSGIGKRLNPPFTICLIISVQQLCSFPRQIYHACVPYVRRDLTHASINIFLFTIVTLLSLSTSLISLNFPTAFDSRNSVKFFIFIAENLTKVREFRDILNHFPINRKQRRQVLHS